MSEDTQRSEVSPDANLAAENPKDESEVITDQDQTNTNDLNISEDAPMGGDGSDSLALVEPDDFTQGDLDVKQQIDRATRVMDNATGRSKSYSKKRKVI